MGSELQPLLLPGCKREEFPTFVWMRGGLATAAAVDCDADRAAVTGLLLALLLRTACADGAFIRLLAADWSMGNVWLLIWTDGSLLLLLCCCW